MLRSDGLQPISRDHHQHYPRERSPRRHEGANDGHPVEGSASPRRLAIFILRLHPFFSRGSGRLGGGDDCAPVSLREEGGGGSSIRRRHGCPPLRWPYIPTVIPATPRPPTVAWWCCCLHRRGSRSPRQIWHRTGGRAVGQRRTVLTSVGDGGETSSPPSTRQLPDFRLQIPALARLS